MYFGFQSTTIAYGRRTILENVTMDFPRGQVSAIIGPNGCGKSSLLKTVSRVVTPVSGGPVLEDRPLRTYSPRLLARKIAYLPQNRMSPRDIDIRTLVSYGRYPYKRFGEGMTAADGAIIDQSLALTGLEGMGDRPLANLSGGERQRAWIAMTLCQQPQILLLDEPITYLDVGYQVEVLELVRSLVDRLGITIVMVLHDMNFTARYAHQVFVLQDGGLLARGSPGDILSRETMEAVFHIGAQVLWDEKNRCPFLIPERLPNQMNNE